MFQFRRFPSYTYLIQYTMHDYESCGLLHSEICGSKLAYSSPQLIAVNHVLHRLPMPRHSPCAHIRFTICEFPLRDHWVCYIVILPDLISKHRLLRFNVVSESNSLLSYVVSSFALHLLFSFQGTKFCSEFLQNKFQKKNLFFFSNLFWIGGP